MKKLLYKTLVILIILSSGCSWQDINKSAVRRPKVRNIILFIGDGMGTAQVYAGMSMSGSPLTLESFPYSGF
ncbi:MAG TPA: hypothetical protein PK719_09675, partial [Bacteroidales bacterium]|nr:hypothetical protein [Bacteroidales bacterium]